MPVLDGFKLTLERSDTEEKSETVRVGMEREAEGQRDVTEDGRLLRMAAISDR